MKRKLIVIIGLTLMVLFLSGCNEQRKETPKEYYECYKAYDNLHLKEGYTIVGHDFDFVCCNPSSMVWICFDIKYNNSIERLGGFCYDYDLDELIWMYAYGYPDYIVDIN